MLHVFALALLPMLLAPACRKPHDTVDSKPIDTGGTHETDSPPDSGDTDDSDETGDTGSPPGSFSGTVEEADCVGTLRISMRSGTGEVRSLSLDAGGSFEFPSISQGEWQLLAWCDEDGDLVWDGTWEGEGEPTALMGVRVPRDPLRVVLRRGVPEPILDADPDWLVLYHEAWRMAESHIAAGTSANGFADHYMDEAFSDQIFQWDTCFMTLFGRQGLDAFPVMGSLDNFYGSQSDNGYICRVVNESDGQPGGDASDPSEPMINPPLFAWSELLYARQTGDLTRIPTVLPALDAYLDWIDASVRTSEGLYYTSMLGSGMDNAPRDVAYNGWVDITAQVALARRSMAELASLSGDKVSEAEWLLEWERVCADTREKMWDEAEGFFFDLDNESRPLVDKNLAGIWPLVAGCATDEQAERVIAHLTDPSEFWRVHAFASTSADSSYFQPAGNYWRGGVWAPTNYAASHALMAYGRRDVARDAAENHLWNLHRVWADYVPDPALLAKDATGDGTGTLWELYAPDDAAPGTRWSEDEPHLGRQDFVGWTGLGPIAMLIEQVIGLEPDATTDTLVWHMGRTDRHGITAYRFGDQLVDLVAEARVSHQDPVEIQVSSSDPFRLVVELGPDTWAFDVPEGDSLLSAGPSESAFAEALVPAGPFPGNAILGNGSISAVYTDDDGTSDPPGIRHLHAGGFDIDLLEAGKLLVVQGTEVHIGGIVGLDPFFAAYTRHDLPDGGAVVWRAFVGEDSAVIFQGVLRGGPSGTDVALLPYVQLRDQPSLDGSVVPSGNSYDSALQAIVAAFSDGRALAVGSSPAPDAWQAGSLPGTWATDGLDNSVQAGEQIAIRIQLSASADQEVPFRWAVAVGETESGAEATLTDALGRVDALADAQDHWLDWSPEILCDGGDLCQVAAANLYAARASDLQGRIPADLTGQFVTAGFPQIYPRDSLMVARTFASTGHLDEATDIVRDWLGSHHAEMSPGELYARYDARGDAVDDGSGARFDVPEWDSNAYLAVLAERLGAGIWSTDERDTLFRFLDFLVTSQDSDGLFTEGGIVEWEGRLPGTAMTLWAGLDAGARLAETWGDPGRAGIYRDAAGRIRGGLLLLLDFDEIYLADERDGALAWDTSLFFGPVWGYPASPLLDATWSWAMDNATAYGGGLRYFEGNDYGEDLFFFTTSGVAAYGAGIGELIDARNQVDWMAAFTTRYGLASERVYDDGSGAAPASPLSWCAAELAATILDLEGVDVHSAPLLDGDIQAMEYRSAGTSVLDADGDPDGVGDAVVLYGRVDGDILSVGLRLATAVGDLEPGTSVDFYLSDAVGVGGAPLTDRGSRLHFRSDSTVEPGAMARVRVDPSSGACEAGPESGGGFTSGSCAGVAVGDLGPEVQVSLAALGLKGHVQVIAVVDDGLDHLLPAHGSLWTEPWFSAPCVPTTFEVDAASVASLLGNGVVVTISGDRPELGAWLGDALALRDDGLLGDDVADDGLWSRVVCIVPGFIEYKYLVGEEGDGSWAGVEFIGDNRGFWAKDVDGTGRVRMWDTFGEPTGSFLLDP